MTEQNKIDYWVDIADYDLKTAEAMLERTVSLCRFYVSSSY